METLNHQPAMLTASVEYRTFDSSRILLDTTGGKPISVVLGQGDMHPKMEAEILHMQPGETRMVKLSTHETWGPPDPERIVDISHPVKNEKAGDFIRLADGREGTIVKISGDMLTVDTNHPWCGLDLQVEIQLINKQWIKEEDPLNPVTQNDAGCCGPAGCC